PARGSRAVTLFTLARAPSDDHRRSARTRALARARPDAPARTVRLRHPARARTCRMAWAHRLARTGDTLRRLVRISSVRSLQSTDRDGAFAPTDALRAVHRQLRGAHGRVLSGDAHLARPAQHKCAHTDARTRPCCVARFRRGSDGDFS